MSKKLIAPLLLMTALAVVGCGGNKADDKPTGSPAVTSTGSGPGPSESAGASTGKKVNASSEPDEQGSSAEMSITWDGDTITDVQWKEYSNGELKDENYGKDLDAALYDQAQKALEASKTYPEQLLEKQDINKVDAVSGATTSHDSFKKLYDECLEQK